MKYNEEHIQQLIETVKTYQAKLQLYNHDDIHTFNTKLNRTIMYVILSMMYNRHLPATVFSNEEAAIIYIEDVLGREIMNLVGFNDTQWFEWINKSIYEKQKFPYNIINYIKIKLLHVEF